MIYIVEFHLQSQIVYFDGKYPSSWTKGVCRRVSEYLSQQGFVILDANALRQWMKETISGNEANKTVLVFANDIVPDTVYEDGTPNIMIRKYLDKGGRVVWIGDIPFWYKGVSGKFDLSQDTAYQSITFLGVLGVTFTLALPSEHVQLTTEAKQMGLEKEWYGIRPTSVEKNNKSNFFLSKPCEFTALGTSKTIFTRHFIKKQGSWIEKIDNINLGVAGFAGGLGIKKAEKDEVDWGKEYVSSFKITFNDKSSNQGFIRIWDFPIYEVSDEMLSELEKIAIHKL